MWKKSKINKEKGRMNEKDNRKKEKKKKKKEKEKEEEKRSLTILLNCKNKIWLKRLKSKYFPFLLNWLNNLSNVCFPIISIASLSLK